MGIFGSSFSEKAGQFGANLNRANQLIEENQEIINDENASFWSAEQLQTAETLCRDLSQAIDDCRVPDGFALNARQIAFQTEAYKSVTNLHETLSQLQFRIACAQGKV